MCAGGMIMVIFSYLFVLITVLLSGLATFFLTYSLLSDEWEYITYKREGVEEIARFKNHTLYWLSDHVGWLQVYIENLDDGKGGFKPKTVYLVPAYGGVNNLCLNISKNSAAKMKEDGYDLDECISYLSKEKIVSKDAWLDPTYPLDITKTRIQIQGETALNKFDGPSSQVCNKIKARGMLHTAIGIVQEEGLFKLWQGVTPAIYRHLVYSGCRMTFYEVFREKLLKTKTNGAPPLWKTFLCGSTSGALGQFLASPTDLVKVQMQMEGRRRLEGYPPRVTSTWHAFKKIIAESGIRGLWKGWVPNVQRAALVNMGDLTTYENAKHFILRHSNLKDNWLTHMLASSCSGLIAATLGTPADVVKTRVMNQPTDTNGKGLFYKSSIDCLVKTVQEEGFMALYKGFIPIWTRMAPWSITFWVTYEELRRVTGVSSF